MKQLTFENLVTEEKETPEIIPIRADGLQPRKLEELLPNADILVDTYLIYPDGGYHPFYGVPNTFPIYQQKIFPFIKRIKFSEKWGSEESLNNIRISRLRPGRKNRDLTQINAYLHKSYFYISFYQKTLATRNNFTHIKIDGACTRDLRHTMYTGMIHRISALAFIPNPENKPFVLHINDDPTNFLLSNLKWGTGSENMKGVRRLPDTMEQKYLNLVDQGLIKG